MISPQRPSLLAAVAVVLATLPTLPLHAQSPHDGFTVTVGSSTVRALAVQPGDGKILVGGNFTIMEDLSAGSVRNRIARLNADGQVDLDFDPNANGDVYAIAVQADGKILLGGAFWELGGPGAAVGREGIARLNADGSLDEDFDPGMNGSVYSLVVQPDGKILVGGSFNQLGGSPRTAIGRLNADGSVDASFNPGANFPVYAMALQQDGRIVVGGSFTGLGGGTGTTARSFIGRLNADGTVDSSFDPGANNRVNSLVVQPDGKVLVGGIFNMVGGGGSGSTVRGRIARLLADGTVDSGFDPSANNIVHSLALQPDGRILVGGDFTALGGAARQTIGRLHPDGSLDADFDPAATGYSEHVYAVTMRADGRVLFGGAFVGLGGGVLGGIAQRNVDGSSDRDFAPVVGSGTPASTTIYAMAVQPDGQVLVGGYFSNLGGCGLNCRGFIGRLNADGTLDNNFNPGANNLVMAIAVQPDGKILVGGTFTMLGGGVFGTMPRNRIGRLNADGTLDTTFDPANLGANSTVSAIAVQADGRILVAGSFTQLGGTTRNYIGRLNADGSLDASFNPGANNYVNAMALQRDGSVVIAGRFTTLGGQSHTYVGRVNSSGVVDAAFTPTVNNWAYTLAVQPDGKILVGGLFSTLGGLARSRIGRLNVNGTGDTSFTATGVTGSSGASEPTEIFSLQLRANGKILVGGDFTGLNGAPANFLGQLHSDGSRDTDFPAYTNNQVNSIALQPDGRVLIGGYFSGVAADNTSGYLNRQKIARLSSLGGVSESLSMDCTGCVPVFGSVEVDNILWTRDGAGPELARAEFAVSSNGGTTYDTLGPASGFPGGWQYANTSWPANQNLLVRARGYHATGFITGSGSMVESFQQVYISCPLIAETTLTAGTVGLAYSERFTAPNALGVLSFVVTGGTLPGGLTLSSDGGLSGTPNATGSFDFTVTATDGSSGCSGSQAVTLAISPVVPRFADVPTDYWAFDFIEALAGAGITSGCGGGNYCPEGLVTRAQMAIFLERGMRGSGYIPPAATGGAFLDVAANSFGAGFIEQLAADGITSGCGGGNYCPSATVTRDQMAVFLLRGIYGSSYAPPPPSGDFGDVPAGHWAAAWIEQLAAEGITSGCGNGNYCPNSPVTRAQMAVFLVRAFLQ